VDGASGSGVLVFGRGELEESVHGFVADARISAPDLLEESAGAVPRGERILRARDRTEGERSQEENDESSNAEHGVRVAAP
jgi:hypothetical protein